MKFNLLGKVASLVLGTAMLICPANLQAGWGILHGGSSGGSSGFGSGGSSGGSSGYAASYSSYGGSSGGSSGYSVSYASSGGGSSGYVRRPGLLQRLHDRIHARRSYHASYGSSGYGSSGYGSSGYSTSYASSGGGSSGGSSGGYGVSYGSSGGVSYNYGSVGYSSGVSYGSTGYSSSVNYGSTGYSSGYGGVYYGASNVDVGAETDGLVSSVESNSLDDAVYLTVAVPNGAKVYVNDKETTSSGVVRKFVSRGLQAGKQYRFEVRAEMVNADGKLMTEKKALVVSAGEEQQVQFAFAEQDSRVETAITLNLPEGANVTLAGNATKATGEARTFRTSRLKSGEFWDDYEIEVEYQGEVKRQAIRLVGGDKLQLTFDFDSPASTLAAR